MSSESGGVLWFTGLPGSGKTTLAKATDEGLRKSGLTTMWLDSDDLRSVLTPQATYDGDERDRFYEALGHVALLSAAGGAYVIVSATAPKREYRDRVRRGVNRFVEIHVQCDLATVEERDPKGLYLKARSGEIQNMPGLDAPYEEPLDAEVTVNTASSSIEESAAHILTWLATNIVAS